MNIWDKSLINYVYRVVSESFATGCSYFSFNQKSNKYSKHSQLTHLMSTVLFNILWKLWFFMFLEGIKKASDMRYVKKHFL